MAKYLIVLPDSQEFLNIMELPYYLSVNTSPIKWFTSSKKLQHNNPKTVDITFYIILTRHRNLRCTISRTSIIVQCLHMKGSEVWYATRKPTQAIEFVVAMQNHYSDMQTKTWEVFPSTTFSNQWSKSGILFACPSTEVS